MRELSWVVDESSREVKTRNTHNGRLTLTSFWEKHSHWLPSQSTTTTSLSISLLWAWQLDDNRKDNRNLPTPRTPFTTNVSYQEDCRQDLWVVNCITMCVFPFNFNVGYIEITLRKETWVMNSGLETSNVKVSGETSSSLLFLLKKQTSHSLRINITH